MGIFKEHWIWKPGMPTHNKNGSTVFYIRAPHHAYLGIALIIMGWLSQPYYDITTPICYLSGGLILADDLIEHTITENTPLRLFFNKFNFWLK